MASNKVLYFEGIDDILISFWDVAETITTAPTFGAKIYRFPIATKLAVKGNGSTMEKWASSKIFRRASRETKHELGLDHVGIPVDVLDQMKGLVAKKGVVFNKSTVQEYPFFAFGFIGRIEGGERMAVWYPKVQLDNATDLEYETAEEETDIKDVTTNFVATPLLYNEVINAAFDSTRESADLITLDKFIEKPIYDEKQLEDTTP